MSASFWPVVSSLTILTDGFSFSTSTYNSKQCPLLSTAMYITTKLAHWFTK